MTAMKTIAAPHGEDPFNAYYAEPEGPRGEGEVV